MQPSRRSSPNNIRSPLENTTQRRMSSSRSSDVMATSERPMPVPVKTRLARYAASHAIRASLCVALYAATAGAMQAIAGVTPTVSRVVMPGDVTEVSAQLVNINTYPVLVQAWVDDGELHTTPQESTAPVIALPPIFRMDAHERTSLRLINSGAPLPADRESLFWLNLHEIPLTQKNRFSDGQTVTITMRTQFKVFVRPVDKLPYPATELPKRLTFSLTGANAGLLLSVHNPTPYYATINMLDVSVGDTSQPAVVNMLAPFSESSVRLEGLRAQAGDHAKVKFALIDDDGAAVEGERSMPVNN
ncbi:molecular chaperone [Paraburkholderia denitrificans]|uniref:Molecular chaperone n=1 Tax=Paraburkholderia denitrificans TaxID=694025 RepID=A0ABW0J9B9_9BURK